MRTRRWRYVVPNALTASSLLFSVLAVESAVRRRPVAAAWWGLYCTLSDKLDGLAARWLDAGSAFGMQLDSLADLAAFGVVPPTVMLAFFAAHPELGWSTGAARAGLVTLSALYVIAAAARLARFNVAAAAGPVHYRGVPSTMTAGLVLSLFVACLKYASPALSAPETHDAARLLDGVRSDGLVGALPLLLALGAVGMVAPLRVPRLGRTRHRITDALLIAAVVAGYAAGLLRCAPELLAAGGLGYLAFAVAYHLRTRGA